MEKAGDGVNFKEDYKAVKNLDQSRPVLYERSDDGEDFDLYVPMYAGYEHVKKYAETGTKPIIQ